MLPKAGTKLHRVRTDQDVADLVAGALAFELGRTHQAVKTAKTRAPCGDLTVSLAGKLRRADQVKRPVTALDGRQAPAPIPRYG